DPTMRRVSTAEHPDDILQAAVAVPDDRRAVPGAAGSPGDDPRRGRGPAGPPRCGRTAGDRKHGRPPAAGRPAAGRALDRGTRGARVGTVAGHLVRRPATLHAGGELLPDLRRIGLYDVLGFRWQADVQAAFAPLPLPAVDGRRYGTPYLVLGVDDVRGLVGH